MAMVFTNERHIAHTREVGNFVIDNTKYAVLKVVQGDYRYVEIFHEGFGYGYSLFGEEKAFEKDDTELTVEALLYIVRRDRELKEMLGY